MRLAAHDCESTRSLFTLQSPGQNPPRLVARDETQLATLTGSQTSPVSVKTRSRIATWQRLRQQATWKMLAADNAPIVAALLQGLLFDAERQLPASLLHERLARELEELRAHGHDLPRTAQAYVAEWLAAGWLERRFPAAASEEQYELSTQAIVALRFLATLDNSRSVATESRLALVIQQLVQLARQTDTDPHSRLTELLAERERIDAEIATVNEGRVDVLDDTRALERARDIVALADELAEDFRHVRDEFQRLDRDFRERIIDDERQRGEVLEALFAGVDVIAESESGRSFDAFWRLLTDPEQSGQLEAAVDAVTGRPFASRLDRRERGFLLHLTRTLLDRGGHVHDVLQHFARSLKGFVQSRAYLEQRRLHQLLKQAQADALKLRDQVRGNREIGYTLALSSARLHSLARWRLDDPRAGQVDGSVARAGAAAITLDGIGELVAQSEIDFRTLKQRVRALLDEHAQCSIGNVLDHYPAEQGLGSVVGYVALGSRHGTQVSHQFEAVTWRGGDGCERHARIPLIYFLRDNRDELV